MKAKKIAIIGGGPIGLESALYARQLGFDVDLFEKNQVGSHILSWGHVTLFSPWEMNHSPLGVRLLKKQYPSWREPGGSDYLTGKEFVETYLQPLNALPPLADRIHTGLQVHSISREGALKGDLIGDSRRSNHPFRILTIDSNDNERIYRADIIIDAGGVYGNPNWLGTGGIPALGELQSCPYIDYIIPNVYGADRKKFANKKTLLIGSGYSAATVACDFQNLMREEPQTSLLWVIREKRDFPIPEIEHDQLPNRANLTKRANSMVRNRAIQFRNNTSIDSVHYSEHEDKFEIGLKTNSAIETLEVDRVIANVGYGPDNSIYRELQVHECYTSRGPMKLAAALLGSSSTDCLAQESPGADMLKNPEPNFFIIGNKSYGRNPTFLIRIGLEQITGVFSLITGKVNLNLYDEVRQENKEAQL